MKMNYVDALNIAIAAMSAMDEQDESTTKAIEKLVSLRTTYANRNASRPGMSDEKKAEISAKRKAETAAKRKELLDVVVPVLRKYLVAPLTAKQLFEVAKNELPADFSWNKVQNILIREMAPDLIKTEVKGQSNTYVLK